MGQRRTFTADFKREVMKLLESGSRPASKIAHDLGIKRNPLYKWQTELKIRGGGRFLALVCGTSVRMRCVAGSKS